jgi:hypothetical protein
VTLFRARWDSSLRTPPQRYLCDAWVAGDLRFDHDTHRSEGCDVVGTWPSDLETDAARRLAETVGTSPTWTLLAAFPAVAQKLAERAKFQPMDREIERHLRHLQHVCYRPRLNLRIEEERLPVSRARRSPVRAVADLVSHPGDWERRTIRSIQPSRVLARQVEDEWNLYENRVAARLVDHLLAYLNRRLEELRKIREVLEGSRDHGDELRRTSHWRARRISQLWATTLDSRTEAELGTTIRRLEQFHGDLQALIGSVLYEKIPRKQSVPLILQPTNILLNDTHYRKVAALWRAWLMFGHKPQESAAQRLARRQLEATAWDRFVLHLLIRSFAGLGWHATGSLRSLTLSHPGFMPVQLEVQPSGCILLAASTKLALLPLCASLAKSDAQVLEQTVADYDHPDLETALIHVGSAPAMEDSDRATGWFFSGRTVLLGCSPWGIDSEERMTRLLNGWLSRAARSIWPVTQPVRALPPWPGNRDWISCEQNMLIAFRAPTVGEASEAKTWARKQLDEWEHAAVRAKAAKQSAPAAPREALHSFQTFLEQIPSRLDHLETCPVCKQTGTIQARPGQATDGSDATWWATCAACGSEWGTRPCTNCHLPFAALHTATGTHGKEEVAASTDSSWPDKWFGRDLWAKPCKQRLGEHFRCPRCGSCGNHNCSSCRTFTVKSSVPPNAPLPRARR